MSSHPYHINDIFVSQEQIDISRYDEVFLMNTALRRCEICQCESVEAYIELLENSELERMTFFDALQIGYSSFFRNPFTFHTLEKLVFPELLIKLKNNKSKDLRIWSAACSAGQEAYSVAMLVDEQKICTEGNCNCMIFATDRDEELIEQAYKGQYARHNLENISLAKIDKWFIKYGETYFIKPELKKRISFSVFDLFDENCSSPPTSIFGHFDIIFCANLLFYYKEKYRKIILDKIEGAMAEKCYLVTGESERDILVKYKFREIYPQSAIFIKN